MNILKEIQSYTLPVYHSTRCGSYIDFYAFDPSTGKMRRKMIKLNFIHKKNRRKYANDYIKRICHYLSNGWNPFVSNVDSRALFPFDEVCDSYLDYLTKMARDGSYREETFKSYSSYMKNLREFNKAQGYPVCRINQFDKLFCVSLLDEVYIHRNNSAYTRDNYLQFLHVFGEWLTVRDYLRENPAKDIKPFGSLMKTKIRTVIPKNYLSRINDYLNENNKYYLLSCYLLYYCFIRPNELSQLKLEYFKLQKQTIVLPPDATKNRKGGVVTLPKKVLFLMLDLGVFDYPGSYYLFGKDFKPSENPVSSKIFRDYWTNHVRKDLKLPKSYKFYSLKDSGITNMLGKESTLSVRDQARHSSIKITDIYTPHDSKEANLNLTTYEDDF